MRWNRVILIGLIVFWIGVLVLSLVVGTWLT